MDTTLDAAKARPQVTEDDVRAGIDNLLQSYLKLGPGRELLIINEPAMDRRLDTMIEARARALGARVITMWADRCTGPETLPPAMVKAFEAADITLFNHPAGGMLRLLPIGGTGLKCFSFANTMEIMGSAFCRVPFDLSAAVLRQVQGRLDEARSWRITCPAGTDLAGRLTAEELAPRPKRSGQADGFTLLTFPLGVHRPFSTFEASGRLAVHWLTPSGIHEFTPAGIRLEQPVRVEVERGRMGAMSGPPAEVARLRAYLEKVGGEVGKDPYIVNSWHAGINPLAFSPYRDTDSLERWMFLAHANPRIVQFHALGADQPGEMSIPVLDPTISLDGEPLWEDGRLTYLDRDTVRAGFAAQPGYRDALVQTLEVGV
jgi:hypothetical protein